MRDREPTIRSRELGEGLRRAMEHAGKEAAKLLDWSPSWVSRLLSGKRHAAAVHVAAFLAVCRVTGAERDRLLALCEEQHTGLVPATRLPPAPAASDVHRSREQGGDDQRVPGTGRARPIADR